MRRRRIADAPTTPATAEEAVLSSQAADVTAQPEPVEPTTRETTRTPDATATDTAIPESVTTPTESAEAPVAPKPRQSRRRTKADAVPEAPADTTGSNTVPIEPAAPTTEVTVESVESAPDEAPPAKPRRAPRRRKADTAEVATAPETVPITETAEPTPALIDAVETSESTAAVGSAAPADTPVEAVVEPSAEAVSEAVPEEAPTKARRPRRGRKSAAPTVEATAEESANEAVTPIDTSVSVAPAVLEAVKDAAAGLPVAVAEPTPVPQSTEVVPVTGIVQTVLVPAAEAAATTTAPKRTRGLRRSAPAAIPALPAPPAYVPPAETEAPQVAAEAAPAPKRTRGLRRTPRPAVVLIPTTPTTQPGVITIAPPVPVGYQPLPAEVLERLAETRVNVHHGWPELAINGTPTLPFWFFVNTEDPDARDTAVQEIRLAYEAGVRTFSVLAHLPWKKANGERRREPLDDALRLIAENAPGSFILPRLIFSPPASWVRTHEDDMTVYADGEGGDVSLASRAFWEQDAVDALRAAVEQIAQGDYAGQVFGIYLEHGEWFYERGHGYDVSNANTDGFRAWLRTHYKGSLVNLRASWHDGSVTFDNAAIPQVEAPSDNSLFFTNRQQRYADYNEYASDLVAQVINRLGKTVKEASANRLAVAVSYGYTLELPRAASGHLALSQILSAPHVDILTGPLSYSSRTAGGSAPLPAPVDSIHLAGKLWVSEDDTKTYLATTDESGDNPRIEREETFAVHSRNFGAALSRGAGISYMDLWGQGWLADRGIWESLGKFKQIGEQVAALRREQAAPASGPDVAVIVDERSFFGVRADEELLASLVSDQRDALVRSGARIGYYLMSDLTHANFPTSPRLMLFLNAFTLPEATRLTLRERFQGDGRTFAFVYGPGVREENLSELTDALGIQVRLQPWGSKIGTQVLSGTRSPLTDGVQGQKLGDEERVNPSLYVVDPKAQILGEYTATGNTSLAVRKHTRWQSVFIGERGLSLPLLRGLFRLAGVPIFTVDDDVAWVDDQIICLHSAPGGGTTLYLREESGIADLLTGEVLASDGFGARFAMPPRGTRLLLIGNETEAARFGIDLRAGQSGLTEDERLVATPPFAPEATPAVTLPRGEAFLPTISGVSAEDEALFAAALAGELSLDANDSEDTESGEPLAAEEESASRRKRRRRRGRGRNDEDKTPLAEDGNVSDTADDNGEALPEPFLPVVEDVTRGRAGRPSLDELLPLSEVPADAELPPVPDELLPLDGDALNGTDTAEAEIPLRRNRRGRTRRTRTSDRAMTEDAPEAASEEAVDAVNMVLESEEEANGMSDEALIAPREEEAEVPTEEMPTEIAEPNGISELTSVGLDESPEDDGTGVTPSGIAGVEATPEDAEAATVETADAIAEAAEALGADITTSVEDGVSNSESVPAETDGEPDVATAEGETREAVASDDPAEAGQDVSRESVQEDGNPIPVERPDVSSGEANPS